MALRNQTQYSPDLHLLPNPPTYNYDYLTCTKILDNFFDQIEFAIEGLTGQGCEDIIIELNELNSDKNTQDTVIKIIVDALEEPSLICAIDKLKVILTWELSETDQRILTSIYWILYIYYGNVLSLNAHNSVTKLTEAIDSKIITSRGLILKSVRVIPRYQENPPES